MSEEWGEYGPLTWEEKYGLGGTREPMVTVAMCVSCGSSRVDRGNAHGIETGITGRCSCCGLEFYAYGLTLGRLMSSVIPQETKRKILLEASQDANLDTGRRIPRKRKLRKEPPPEEDQ